MEERGRLKAEMNIFKQLNVLSNIVLFNLIMGHDKWVTVKITMVKQTTTVKWTLDD